jgi:GDP-L-fucose synthase
MIGMKIFIAGGTGFIGKNIIEQLGGVYTFFSPSHSVLDLLDKQAVLSFLEKTRPDIVIFSANVGGKRNQSDQNFLQDNLRMFFNVVSGKKYFGRMIVLGSGAEYDKRRPIVKIKEDSFGECIPADAYGFGKYIMSEFSGQVDYITHLRLFGIYGKNEDYQVRFISNTICKKLFGLPITMHKNVFFDYIYIKDLVNILKYFIENKPKEKYYNIGMGEPVDLLSLARIINDLEEGKQEIKIKVEGLNNEYSCNTDRLKECIGDYKFTSHKEAIKEMFEYYKSIKEKLDKKVFLEED